MSAEIWAAIIGGVIVVAGGVIGLIIGIGRFLVSKLWAQMEREFNTLGKSFTSLSDQMEKIALRNDKAHENIWKNVNRIKQAHAVQHGEIIEEAE
jgi:spore maturation protein CgeB